MSTNQPTPPETLPEDVAMSEGYRPLTTGYNANERWMMHNVIADMQRGNIKHVIVEQNDGPEVWRKGLKKGEEAYK